jgi:hypothetical protein
MARNYNFTTRSSDLVSVEIDKSESEFKFGLV